MCSSFRVSEDKGEDIWVAILGGVDDIWVAVLGDEDICVVFFGG